MSLFETTLVKADDGRLDGPLTPSKKPRRGKYRRSKLTSDESEEVADKRFLRLTTGENKAIDLDFDVNGGVGGISIGNPLAVTYTLVKIGDKRQIVFTPLKAGETTVTIRDSDGTIRLIFSIRVVGSNLLRIAGEIRNLLRDIEGLEIRIVGPKVVLDGEVLVPADYSRVLMVIQDKSYSDFVMNLTALSPLAMQVMAKKIQEDVNGFGATNVKTRVVNGIILLEGTVDNADQAKRALEVAYLYLPDVKPSNALERDPSNKPLPPRKPVMSYIMVSPPPAKKQEKLVRVTIHFVELSKDYNKLFGFKWQPGFSADPQIQIGQNQAGAAAGNAPTLSGAIGNLLPQLQSAQQAGFARVLKTGTLIVRSGQPAKLVEQTQYTYTMAGQNGQVSAASKDVGLTIAVTPQILGQSEDIQMDLELDQTDLVGRAPASNAPPVTAAHKVSTKVYVKSNESAAVGGITSTELGTDFNKDDPLPGTLGASYSPLFSLLRSKAYRKTKTQFVIFVTPQIIENASDGTDDLKKNFRIKVK